MRVIPPITITDALLTSSTVVETAPAAYDAGTTYALDDTVSVAGSAGLNTVYKSLQNGNLANTPASSPLWWVSIGQVYQAYSGAATYALADRVQDNTNHLIYESLSAGNIGNALTDTTKWLEVGPTNKWAMFDLLRSTQTTVPTTMTIVLTPGERVDSIGLLGLVGTSVTVQVSSVLGGGVVYTSTTNLSTRYINNWYDYFFLSFISSQSICLFDLPPYSDGIITITVDSTYSDVSIGACAIGLNEYIGQIQYDAESDVLNFSTVTRDFAGGTNTMVQRRNVPKTNQQLYLEKSRVNRVRMLRDNLNATPAVWSGIDDITDDYFEAILILGFYKQFSINVRYPDFAVINLQLEEI